MLKKAEAYWPLILLLAVIKFVLPLFLQSPIYELQRDEYLYYQQGQHFAIGYLENPPLLSWLGMISSWFGGSEGWIKFWPCLFGAGTLILTCLITAELGGKVFAQFLAALGLLTGSYLRVHYLFQPNFLDIFFWTLSIYFLIRYINTKNQQFIYWMAVSLALGWWGKYSILFMDIAIVAGLLVSQYRNVLTKKQTWLAMGIAAVIILPNIWWQYQHNWPLVHHMKELKETQLKYNNKADFLKEQFMMLLGVAAVWIVGLIWFFRNKQYRIIAFIYFFVILLLLFGSGKAYYALGAYPMLFAAGAVAWEKWTDKKRWIRYVISLLIIGFTYLIIPILLPTRQPEKLAAFYKKIGMKHKWEDQQNHPLPQDFADMLGWKELTEKTENFYTTLPDSLKKTTLIFCGNYGQAGSLKYYSKDNAFKSAVISSSGSFILWMPEQLTMKNLLLVDDKMPDKKNPIFQHFQKMTIIDSVTNPYSRQLGNKIIFFENIDSAGLQLVQEGLTKKKSQFQR